MTVGVVIGTFGDRHLWSVYAGRAISSVVTQTVPADDFIWVHAETLQEARNKGGELLGDCDHLIFLDGDDELDRRYIEAMTAAERWSTGGWTTPGEPGPYRIFRPSTLGVYEDNTTDVAPVMIPRTDLRRANCIVIGAMCPSKLFFEVGGFGDYAMLEDFALWRAMAARGAAIVDVPDATYRVHVRPGSRNTDEDLHGRIYTRILREVPL